ncbi:MAG: hypothetical protein MK210_05510 [Dehalococcoidia bacterium]|nr:hypothetical protein [Dehalococcoidia bacterium]
MDRAVHPMHVKRHGLSPGAFLNASINGQQTKCLSVDWAILTSPEDMAQDWIGTHPNWGKVAIASITNLCFLDNNQYVYHSPELGNYAHFNLCGEKDDAVRARLAECANLILRDVRPNT